jgi:hypothetical protein
MTSSIKPTQPDSDTPRASNVSIEKDDIVITLTDDTTVRVPTCITDRLTRATPEQRKNWRLIADGTGIHWPDIDEDLSVVRLMRERGDGTRERDEN